MATIKLGNSLHIWIIFLGTNLVLGQDTCSNIVPDFDLPPGVPDHLYPFGESFNDTIAPLSDDESTGLISIDEPFPFFDEYHDELAVNNNGIISFITIVSQFTPDPFPLGQNRRLIAPFWADVDTSINGTDGRVYYRETRDTDILCKASLEVRNCRLTSRNFEATWAFVATWHNVTYFGGNSTTPVNTFQAVLVTDGTQSYTIFNYGDITWTTGTASGGDDTGLGGTQAQIGFNAGDGIRFASVNGSRTPDIVNIDEREGNCDDARAHWIFRIDVEEVEVGMCGMNGALIVSPRIGLRYGGKEVFMGGPCFENVTSVRCRFGNFDVPGQILSASVASCITPHLPNAASPVYFAISLDDGQSFPYSTSFYIVESDPEYDVTRLGGVVWLADPFYDLTINWDPTTLAQSMNVRVELVSLGDTAETFEYVALLVASTPNNGSVTLPRLSLPDVVNPGIIMASMAAIKVSSANQTSTQQISLWSDLHSSQWFFVAQLHEVVTRADNNEQLSPEALALLATIDIAEQMDTVPTIGNGRKRRALIGRIIAAFVIDIVSDIVNSELCDLWADGEASNPPDWSEVIDPPCEEFQIRKDDRFVPDRACNPNSNSLAKYLSCAYFHNGADGCYRTAAASASGHGQQACYRGGRLITDPTRGGGTLDRAAASSGGSSDHVFQDVIPYLQCCKFSNNCGTYFRHRPTSDCTNYDGPQCSWSGGDPHLISLDSLNYTYNGKGEFWVVQHPDVGIQLRTTLIPGGRATAVTAAVIQKGNYRVQIEIGNLRALVLRVNGVRQDLDDFADQRVEIAQGLGIHVNSANNEARVCFNGPTACSGEALRVKFFLGTLSVIASLPSCYMGTTSGLLGNYDGDSQNDLTSSSGITISPSSDLETIHDDFGESWRVTEAESLFTYPLGESYADYQDPDFRPDFPDLNNAAAASVCGDNPPCRYDYIVTGDENFARQTLETNRGVVQGIIDLARGSDACSSQPCQNGAQCMANSDDNFSCTCTPGFAGTICNVVTNPCQCINGGTCLSDGTCACRPDYTGSKCADAFVPCSSTSQCNNGGLCQSDGRCSCKTGFMGERCDIKFDPCTDAPCQNGGTCRLDGTCSCVDGFSGAQCQTGSFNCQTTEGACQNGGMCLTSSGVCSCQETYTGPTCDRPLGCQTDPCMNGGTCFDTADSFYCSCPNGYTGTDCGAVSTQCTTSTCQNGGTCYDLGTDYNCVCPLLYDGPNCENDLSGSCAVAGCENGGTCVDLPGGGFICNCPMGFSGQRCSTQTQCDSTSCENGGTCYDLPSGFFCVCPPPYVGDTCTETQLICTSDFCKNNGQCDNTINGPKCQCPPTHNGPHCEFEVGQCTPNYCANGGTCTEVESGRTCTCAPGYTGPTCAQPFGLCQPNSCENGGTCHDLGTTIRCECPPDFGGPTCSSTSPCRVLPCENGGTCYATSGGTEYVCDCRLGYAGPTCGIVISLTCSDNPCFNGGTCISTSNSYFCRCLPNWTGRNCLEPLRDFCSFTGCLNGGTCVDLGTSYICRCPVGTEPPKCTAVTAACNPNPCLNGGICYAGATTTSFTCSCRSGYSGRTCEIGRTGCSSSPCWNGGWCRETAAGFECYCREGYYGDTCRDRRHDCDRNPCENGGVCKLSSNPDIAYWCECPDGYMGLRCEQGRGSCESNHCAKGATCIPDGTTKLGYRCVCRPDSEGLYCQDGSKPLDSFDVTRTIIIIVVVLLIVIILIVIFVLVCLKKWQRKRDCRRDRSQLVYADNTYLPPSAPCAVAYAPTRQYALSSAPYNAAWMGCDNRTYTIM